MKIAKLIVPMVAAAALFTVGGCSCCDKDAAAAASPGMMNTTCPYSGKTANASITADYQGGKVGFCCAGCKEHWGKDDDTARAALLSKAK